MWAVPTNRLVAWMEQKGKEGSLPLLHLLQAVVCSMFRLRTQTCTPHSTVSFQGFDLQLLLDPLALQSAGSCFGFFRVRTSKCHWDSSDSDPVHLPHKLQYLHFILNPFLLLKALWGRDIQTASSPTHSGPEQLEKG